MSARDRYQFVNDGANSDGPKATGERIGNQSTDEGGKAGSSTKIGEGVGGFHQWHV